MSTGGVPYEARVAYHMYVRPYSKNIGRKRYLHIVLENKRKNDKEFQIHLFNLEYIEKIIFYIFAGISI